METALAKAISAKKCFINVNGFSPCQIVLERNGNLPSMCNDKLLADLPRNKIIIEHLLVLHATRQTFIATELSKKLKAALQKKTRQRIMGHGSDHGSQVYYKWNGDQKWKGLGKVVWHGGFFIKAHCSCMQLAHDLENSNSNH